MSVIVLPVTTPKDRRRFVMLPWRLYRGDPNWVPPLISDMNASLTERGNAQFAGGPHCLALAYRSDRGAAAGARRTPPVGRIAVGINLNLQAAKGAAQPGAPGHGVPVPGAKAPAGKLAGYITLFESVDDYEVAKALFDWAVSWLRERGATLVKGPVSPTNGDDYRGLLVMGHGRPPVLLDAYNPPYYQEFFERYGFTKDIDLFAYHYREDEMPGRLGNVVGYAMRRYGFRTDPVDLANLPRDLADLKSVVDRAMPEDWEDLVPPSIEEIGAMARRLKPLVAPDLCRIARTSAGEPIGFIVALPDYNQVLIRLGGRLFPFGILKFLWLRRKVDGVRIFICFVVPEWRKKGVTGAMFYDCLVAARRRGYKWGEGSTIGETNLPMRRDAERCGGKHYKTYRIYRKELA